MSSSEKKRLGNMSGENLGELFCGESLLNKARELTDKIQGVFFRKFCYKPYSDAEFSASVEMPDCLKIKGLIKRKNSDLPLYELTPLAIGYDLKTPECLREKDLEKAIYYIFYVMYEIYEQNYN